MAKSVKFFAEEDEENTYLGHKKRAIRLSPYSLLVLYVSQKSVPLFSVLDHHDFHHAISGIPSLCI